MPTLFWGPPKQWEIDVVICDAWVRAVVRVCTYCTSTRAPLFEIFVTAADGGLRYLVTMYIRSYFWESGESSPIARAE